MTDQPTFYQCQQGAALVVAMLILSIVTVFAASIAFDYQFSIRRVSNQILLQQAYQYLLATEAIASKALLQDLQNDADDKLTVDRKSEIWAEENMVFTLEDGAYTGKLIDLQGRFNLNSLKPSAFADGQQIPAVPYTTNQGIFIRLLQAVSDAENPLSEQQAKAITESIMDWLDDDSIPQGFACGEDDAYRNIENRQAHRVANGAFYSVSELRLICNLPVELYYRLQPYVTVWPLNGQSSINVNTAGLPVLRSIFVDENDVETLKNITGKSNYPVPPPLAPEIVLKVLAKTQAEALPEQDAQGAESKTVSENTQANDLLTDAVDMGYTHLAEVNADTDHAQLWPNANIGLYSNWFLLESVVQLGRLTQTMSSVISRENGNIHIYARSTGGL